MMRSNTFRIFFEREFSDYAARHREAMTQQIRNERTEYILNVNEAEYLEHLTSKYSIDPLILHFDKVEASSREEMIPAEHFPGNFHVHEGKSYSKPVIKYHLPATGDLELLKCLPSPRVMMSYSVSLENDAVCFDIVDFSNDAEGIKREANDKLRTIKEQCGNLATNVESFNNSLRTEADNVFKARKKELLQRSDTLNQLGVPIRKASNVPSTFAVPSVRKPIVAKPHTTGGAGRSPTPTLDEGNYQEILTVIQHTGQQFERLPRTYADKDEEALRDHLILVLEPNFEYSTSGETFNKGGKTDILVRYEKANVFVAECKFWSGAKNHVETIYQLLSYLTWRDSKTAIVYFMDTKEMAAPLKAIEDTTPRHPCFVKLNDKKGESWFAYTFHLPGDEGIAIRLSVLCFHLPKSPKG